MKKGIEGVRLAALYGYPPLVLGFCGQKNRTNLEILSRFLAGEDDLVSKARVVLATLKASFAYYQLIARVNHLDDPFEKKVVEAYWLGNPLLKKVGLKELKRLILNEFTQPGLLPPAEAKAKVERLTPGVVAHHSFHVFFLGSIRGRLFLNDRLLGACCVGWGKVLALQNSSLLVESLVLEKKDKKLWLTREVKKKVAWERRFLPQIKVGEVVSFHWGRVCQVLTPLQQFYLASCTGLNLWAFNEQHR